MKLAGNSSGKEREGIGKEGIGRGLKQNTYTYIKFSIRNSKNVFLKIKSLVDHHTQKSH